MQIKAFVSKNTKLPVDTYSQFCEKSCLLRKIKLQTVKWNKVFCSIV